MPDPKSSSGSFDLDLEAVFGGITVLVLLVIFGAGTYGWGCNVGKLMNGGCGQNTGCIVVRAVGIPMVPLGAVAGYF